MVQIVENNTVTEKTRELVDAIINQPNYSAQNEAIEAFLSDKSAKEKYRSFMEKRQDLHYKEQQGVEIDSNDKEEIATMQSDLMADSKISSFLQAQESLNATHQAVVGYVGKAMELGRHPSADELAGGGCCGGSGGDEGGCGCD